MDAVAVLTERILNLRRHLIKNKKDQEKKKVMSYLLPRRTKYMKYLYKTDYELYRHVCKEMRRF